MLSDRWQGILDLPPSLIVFRYCLNQLKHTAGVFNMLSKHAMQKILLLQCSMTLDLNGGQP